MIERHGRTVGRSRRAVTTTRSARPPAPVYLGRAGKTIPDVYLSELGGAGHGSKFKWLISTCLAAIVGVCAIFFAIYGAMESRNGKGMLETIATTDVFKPTRQAEVTKRELHPIAPKEDRLEASASGVATKHIIHESVRQRRNTREFITIKPYARIVARLAVERPQETDLIPAFNPFKLYANTKPIGADGKGKATKGTSTSRDGVSVKILELVGGILPADDGLELNDREVAELVARAGEEFNDLDGTGGVDATATEQPSDGSSDDDAVLAETPNTTVLEKTVFESDDIGGAIAGQEVRIVKVRKGDNLLGLIRRAGAEVWQARAIEEQFQKTIKSTTIKTNQEVHFTLVPSPTRAFAMEPVRVSLFEPGHRHVVTVTRDDAGDYNATTKPQLAGIAQAVKATRSERRATLYTSFYHAALSQKLSPDMILKMLRIHAYDTDFSRGVRPGDAFEFFFDLEGNQKSIDALPSELLFTSLTAGGKTRRFYRYRTPDGIVDYYDANGNNSKRFLMRKPVKGGNVRFTSGFGVRLHPILKRRKMHTGVDWAARRGTPILAAGSGTVVEAGRKGGYGNFVRIKHANGYQTTYAHMRRFGAGMTRGVKVRQGQVIGYVGSTGLSSGPHLHYEVLVNNRQVNPMSIHVPRGRQLSGKLLADFQKKRGRIDELMNLAPVTTRVAQAENKG
ncbi:MAG: peptidoglycan DD-metalloendopeptidase family protein [Hyphomicrobiaceae bacterium]